MGQLRRRRPVGPQLDQRQATPLSWDPDPRLLFSGELVERLGDGMPKGTGPESGPLRPASPC
jgi:hypothetical protein